MRQKQRGLTLESRPTRPHRCCPRWRQANAVASCMQRAGCGPTWTVRCLSRRRPLRRRRQSRSTVECYWISPKRNWDLAPGSDTRPTFVVAASHVTNVLLYFLLGSLELFPFFASQNGIHRITHQWRGVSAKSTQSGQRPLTPDPLKRSAIRRVSVEATRLTTLTASLALHTPRSSHRTGSCTLTFDCTETP